MGKEATDALAAALHGSRSGLIWGFSTGPDGARAVNDCDGGGEHFRWLHLSLAHQGAAGWITRSSGLPLAVREMLLSGDSHQQAMIEEGVVAGVVHDFERDFDSNDTSRIGVIRFALTPTMMITARAPAPARRPRSTCWSRRSPRSPPG